MPNEISRAKAQAAAGSVMAMLPPELPSNPCRFVALKTFKAARATLGIVDNEGEASSLPIWRESCALSV